MAGNTQVLVDTALQRLERVGHESKKKFVRKRSRANAAYRRPTSRNRKRRYYQANVLAKVYNQAEQDAQRLIYENGPIRFRNTPVDTNNSYFGTIGRVIYNYTI